MTTKLTTNVSHDSNTSDQSKKVTIGIIRYRSFHSAFIPGTEIVIHIYDDSGSRRDFEICFKKQKTRQYNMKYKVNKSEITLGNLPVLARKIAKMLTKEVFDIAD